MIFKCKMCGGSLEVEKGQTICECEYCGTKQTVSSTDDEITTNLYNRANNLRMKSEFDKAQEIYEKIITKSPNEAEAYWGVILCKYGIEYVEDPDTYKKVPTCHRTQLESVLTDVDYLSAIEKADSNQKLIYEQEAKKIDKLQKDILAIVHNEKPFDVFICYKETDESGKRTVDSALANDIYYQLTQEGLKVFYAAITLENKLGQEYEPYIFSALNSARVMLVVGTKPENFNSVWVKNEWSRYLKLMKNDRSKTLIPCFRDMDAYDLPDEFSHLQAQDMGKIGFINDVVRGIKKLITPTKTQSESTVIVESSNTDTAPLLKRAFIFLEDGKWQDADEYCERVLDIDPENAQAYLGKLMADVKVRTKEALKNCKEPFASNSNYLKVVRFGDAKLKEELQNYISIIEECNEAERIERIYQNACNLMTKNQPSMYLKAAELFESVADYKDSAIKRTKCIEKAESTRKDIIYEEAKTLMHQNDTPSYEAAIEKFEKISEWRDAPELIAQCKRCIEEINLKKEQDRLEAIRKAEAEKAEKERIAKEKKKKIIITLSSIAAVVVAIVVMVKIVNYIEYKANYIEYKPLSDAFNNNQVTVEYIRDNYSNLQYDKGALQVFEKELEKCHKQNDLKRALEILVVLAESDVVFDYEEYDETGNRSTEFNPHISAWFSFTEWIYSQAQSKGQKIPTEDYDGLVDETYEVYGYKVSIKRTTGGHIYEVVVYVPSVGWYEVSASKKSASNRSFHSKRGGVMVD